MKVRIALILGPWAASWHSYTSPTRHDDRVLQLRGHVRRMYDPSSKVHAPVSGVLVRHAHGLTADGKTSARPRLLTSISQEKVWL